MTDEPHELSDAVDAEVKRLCALGDRHAKAGKYPAALTEYWKAFDLLPEPKTDWCAATRILAAIGDANFLGRDFTAGRDNLANAMHCPDAIGNPFLHLRLGQCRYELGEHDRAADELTRALMVAGEEIFAAEDPKYFAFLKTRLKPPPGGWGDEAQKKKPWWKVW
jgi:tetratricopeptide (TPR) repeat protein